MSWKMTTLELPLQQNGKESYEEDEHNNQDTNLMLQQRKPTILELLIASSTSLASSSSLGNFKVENLSRLTRIASHPFRSLISIKYNSYIFFYYNGRWSDFSIKLDRNIYSLEWDCHTDRLYVGTETSKPISHKYSNFSQMLSFISLQA